MRDYQAELARRNEKARANGYTSESAKRREKENERAQRHGFDDRKQMLRIARDIRAGRPSAEADAKVWQVFRMIYQNALAT